MADPDVLDLPTPPGDWQAPWPNVAEIASVLAPGAWTLIGGLMVQLHGVSRGVGVVRPTNDVDIVLHLDPLRAVPDLVADALESLGYRLLLPLDNRAEHAHRFVRGRAHVDLVTKRETVDVLVAEDVAPRPTDRIRGRTLMKAEGSGQALRRLFQVRLTIAGRRTTLTVPSALGALVLKAAAYQADSHNPERHLHDAAVLLCCLDDPYADREALSPPELERLTALAASMPDSHPAWQPIPAAIRTDGQAALRLLTS
ncbi:hypothetical protein [Nocardioides speluncae]|uniref:hypothetical protein n=1 Tax=Nocardioides speluncae TaxID=2670337 RepID=UPI000D68CFB1|nr:hypothetical protein [Nocardioides speluncae]